MILKTKQGEINWPIKIFRSTVPWTDSFQELLTLWEENGYVEVEQIDGPFCWWEDIGNVMLYEHDTLENLSKLNRYDVKAILFANNIFSNWATFKASPGSVINFNGGGAESLSPWIYWGRYPRLIEEYRKKTFDRAIESVFVGRIENPVQAQYRTQEWKDVISFFVLTNGGETYPLAPPLYLQMLGSSKFGLCLRGYGPKCQREMELMAMGTVPLITPDVDIVNYHNPPVEGTHYFRVRDKQECKKVIQECSDDRWQQMSTACQLWYEDNCSPSGSFSTTCEIIYSLIGNLKLRWTIHQP